MWTETAVKIRVRTVGFRIKGIRQLSTREDRAVFLKEHRPASATRFQEMVVR